MSRARCDCYASVSVVSVREGIVVGTISCGSDVNAELLLLRCASTDDGDVMRMGASLSYGVYVEITLYIQNENEYIILILD